MITDQRGTGRDVSLLSAAIVVVGNIAVFATKDTWVYALVHMFMFPIGGTIFAQLFALARVRAVENAPDQTDALMSILRAAFSLPFRGLSLRLARPNYLRSTGSQDCPFF